MRNNRIDGIAVGLLGGALFAYSLIHHYTDPVRYAWGLSPYLFPTILSVCLFALAVALFVSKEEARAVRETDEPRRKNDAKKEGER